jgi:hypothetical protein
MVLREQSSKYSKSHERTHSFMYKGYPRELPKSDKVFSPRHPTPKVPQVICEGLEKNKTSTTVKPLVECVRMV